VNFAVTHLTGRPPSGHGPTRRVTNLYGQNS
jgi:hypothetical protein